MSTGRYRPDQFSFVEEDSGDVAGWLSFTQTRAGRRQERQEQSRARLRLVGGAAIVALLIVGLYDCR